MTKTKKTLVVAALLLAGAVMGVVAQNMSIGETYLTHLSLLSQLSIPSTRSHAVLLRDTGVVSSPPVATIWYQADPDGAGACTERVVFDMDGDGTVDATDGVMGGTGLSQNDLNCDGTAGA